jgi:excisionase family DNA binding protein
MNIEIESKDIEAIAQRVLELLRPLLSNNGRQGENDTIFDVKRLAEHLHVDPSWIYKQVSFKAIPYFKSGKYVRFKKSAIDKWIENKTVRPIPPLKLIRNKG